MSKHPNFWQSQDSYLEEGNIIEERKEKKPPIDRNKCVWKDCKAVDCKKPWHRPSIIAEQGFTTKLKPLIIWIGASETLVAVLLLVLVVKYANDMDKLFGKEDKMISFLSFAALIILSVSGMILLVSFLLNRRGIMWFYVLLSTFLCIYIFVLSVIMVNYALVMLEKVPYKPKDGSYLLNKAFAIGIVTLFGSVFHFIGTVCVFTYYNLKYIQPVMFNCPAS